MTGVLDVLEAVDNPSSVMTYIGFDVSRGLGRGHPFMTSTRKSGLLPSPLSTSVHEPVDIKYNCNLFKTCLQPLRLRFFLTLRLLCLTVLVLGALLSSFLEEALYKCSI